ncbi:MAG TPA: TadE/TadG family type IV pilus assembly protein [Anaerolineales bacterium]|nr:TadE/TadG family type IV pilus assembly protein [Anaerolineales bacterium]
MNVKSQKLKTGQAIVEFALIALLLFLVVIVIFDLGRAIFYFTNLSNAAREGARYGIIHPDDTSGITASVCTFATSIDLGCPSPTVTVCGDALSPAVPCPDPATSTLIIAQELNAVTNDEYIRIQIKYPFNPVIPLVGQFLNGGQINIDIESTMRIES